jgi:hypothetical protein
MMHTIEEHASHIDVGYDAMTKEKGVSQVLEMMDALLSKSPMLARVT